MKKILFLFALVTSLVTTLSARDRLFKNIRMNEYVRGESVAEWIKDGAFAFDLLPYYTRYEEAYCTTNESGQIYRYDIVNANFLGAWRVNLIGLDQYSENGAIQQGEAEINATPLTDGMTVSYDPVTRLLSANMPGTCNLSATYMSNSINKKIIFNYPSRSTTNVTYVGDLQWRNDWVNDFKNYALNRDTNCNLKVFTRNGCQQKLYENDYIYGSSGNYWNPNCYIPGSNLTYICSDSGYDGNRAYMIGSRVGLNAAHYYSGTGGYGGSYPDESVWLNKTVRDGAGVGHTFTFKRRMKLYQWALNKGIYDNEELSAAWDIMAFVIMDGNECPEECQASIPLGSYEDEGKTKYYNYSNLPVFSTTQHRTVDMYITTGYGSSWTFNTGTSTRADLIDIFNIDHFHSAHGGCSGNPIFMIFDGNTVFLSHYTSAGGGPNYCKAWRIIRDFCNEMNSTCNIYDFVNRTKSVSYPSGSIPSAYTATTASYIRSNPTKDYWINFSSVVNGKGPYLNCTYQLTRYTKSEAGYGNLVTQGDWYFLMGSVLVVLDNETGNSSTYYYTSTYNKSTAQYDVTIEELDDGLFEFTYMKKD